VKRILLQMVAVSLGMVGCVAAAPGQMGQERGEWLAASSEAKSITGDLVLSDARLTIRFSGFPIAEIRRLNANETSAVFAGEGSGSGNLYRLSIPATKQFEHHNTLCGSDETQWMVTDVTGNELQVAFFSGSNMPVFTPEAMNSATDLCGVFTYGR
jgi:hypothetical protein